MKKQPNRVDDDDMRAEYDFSLEKIMARGRGHEKTRPTTIHLAPDVAQVFPDDQSVNEALRLLIRIAKTEAKLARCCCHRLGAEV